MNSLTHTHTDTRHANKKTHLCSGRVGFMYNEPVSAEDALEPVGEKTDFTSLHPPPSRASARFVASSCQSPNTLVSGFFFCCCCCPAHSSDSAACASESQSTCGESGGALIKLGSVWRAGLHRASQGDETFAL